MATPGASASRLRATIVVRLLAAFLLVSIVPIATFAFLSLQEGEAHEQPIGEHAQGTGETGGAEASAPGESLLGIPIATLELAVAGGSLVLAVLMALYIGRTIVRPLRSLETAMGRVEAGDLDVQVSMSSADEIGRLGQAFGRMVEGVRREARIRDLFGQYVSPELARVAIEREGHLEGQVVECSILFADIRGFTALTEILPAHRLIATLNAYLAVMLREVAAEGGIVNKFGGDSILAIFGSPLNPARDHAGRAVRAAVRMNDALAQFNRRQVQAGLHEIRAGFGVATGEVVAGNVGSERKIEYTVIGDAVNLAARLEELTRELGEPILIAAATASQVPDGANLATVGKQTIRGRSEPVEVFAFRGAGAPPTAPHTEAR